MILFSFCTLEWWIPWLLLPLLGALFVWFLGAKTRRRVEELEADKRNLESRIASLEADLSDCSAKRAALDSELTLLRQMMREQKEAGQESATESKESIEDSTQASESEGGEQDDQRSGWSEGSRLSGGAAAMGVMGGVGQEEESSSEDTSTEESVQGISEEREISEDDEDKEGEGENEGEESSESVDTSAIADEGQQEIPYGDDISSETSDQSEETPPSSEPTAISGEPSGSTGSVALGAMAGGIATSTGASPVEGEKKGRHIYKVLTEDNLQIVEGIGPKMEKVLKGEGVSTWGELSDSTPESLRDLLDRVNRKRYRIIDPTSWPRQAGLANRGEWEDLIAYQKGLGAGKTDQGSGKTVAKVEKLLVRLGAIKQWDQDDLKAVEGIGPKIAGILKSNGINTWRTLSTTEVSILRKILDEAGPRFRLADPSTWPKQADMAADGRWDDLEEYQGFLKRGQ